MFPLSFSNSQSQQQFNMVPKPLTSYLVLFFTSIAHFMVILSLTINYPLLTLIFITNHTIQSLRKQPLIYKTPKINVVKQPSCVVGRFYHTPQSAWTSFYVPSRAITQPLTMQWRRQKNIYIKNKNNRGSHYLNYIY